ncbi:nucleotidyltransferase domain-containing protein [bacterium]|nr:nucleotidyltransferase domain-containing protein [bacterium]
MIDTEKIIQIILKHYPDVQAIYFFGSYGTENEWPDSDVDIALLFTPQKAEKAGSLTRSDLYFELDRSLKKQVDLVNLRAVNTVFQKEIIMADRRIYCQDERAADEFEMLTISKYQKLNEERKEIIENAVKDGRFIAA